jgi:hypothetical protein
MHRRIPKLLSVLLLFCGIWGNAKAQGNDDESILPGMVDSSYFTPLAINDTLTQKFLEGASYREVFGYPSITAIDIDRAKKTGAIQADQRFRLHEKRTILHCAGDSIDRVHISLRGVERLLEILSDSMSYDAEELACYFLPRHTFTFVNEVGKIVGVVELCFECGQISVWPDHIHRAGRTTLSRKGLDEMEALCEREGLFPPCVRAACAMYFMDKR